MEPSPPVSPLTSQEEALGPYLRAIARHKLLVALVVLSVVAGSAVWLAVRGESYVATAEVLVSPLPRDDSRFIGLQLVRDSGDPTRTVQTAAEVLTSSEAARATASALGRGYTRLSIEDAIEVEPRGETDVLAITARADAPALAQQLATTYTQTALAQQLAPARQFAAAEIERARSEAEAVRGRGETVDAERIRQFQAVSAGRDPTLSFVERAALPEGPAGPPRALLLVLAVAAGVLLAGGTALLAELTNRRVRDEDELEALYPLPVMTQVPVTRNALQASANGGMPPATREAFRLLAAQFSPLPSEGRVIMVTSASSGDGKSTCAIGLVSTLAAAGHRVLLVDLDLRKPEIGRVFGLAGGAGVESIIEDEDRTLADVVVPVPGVPGLAIAPGGQGGRGSLVPDALQQRVPILIMQARLLADFVVIDTPPLGVISDGLAVARQSDHIVLVSRPGHTDRWQLRHTRDLLERSALPVRGFVVTASGAHVSTPYHAYGEAPKRGRARSVSFARRA